MTVTCMTAARAQPSSWHDRFVEPSVEALLAEIEQPAQEAFTTLREGLLAIDGFGEGLDWRGVPWRWTLFYGRDGATDRERAFLVPAPESPCFAMSLDEQMAEEMKRRRYSRALREPLARAKVVYDVAWVEWPISAVSLAEELAALVALRFAPPAKP